jgi:hypothetical protein
MCEIRCTRGGSDTRELSGGSEVVGYLYGVVVGEEQIEARLDEAERIAPVRRVALLRQVRNRTQAACARQVAVPPRATGFVWWSPRLCPRPEARLRRGAGRVQDVRRRAAVGEAEHAVGGAAAGRLREHASVNARRDLDRKLVRRRIAPGCWCRTHGGRVAEGRSLLSRAPDQARQRRWVGLDHCLVSPATHLLAPAYGKSVPQVRRCAGIW